MGNITSCRALIALCVLLAVALAVTPTVNAASPLTTIRTSHTYAYIACDDGSNHYVTVVSVPGYKAVKTISLGTLFPRYMVASPDGGTVYVAISSDKASNIAVIDTGSDSVTTQISLDSIIRGLAISPDGKTLYASLDNKELKVISTSTNTFIETIAGTGGPLAINPQSGEVYLYDKGNKAVKVIPADASAATKTVSAGDGSAYNMVVKPDGSRLYIANQDARTVTIVDLSTYTVIANINTGGNEKILISPDGSRLYATEYSRNTKVYDTSSNTLLYDLPCSFQFDMALSPDGSALYSPYGSMNKVLYCNTTKGSTFSTFDLNGSPTFLVMLTTSPFVLPPLSSTATPTAAPTPTASPTQPVVTPVPGGQAGTTTITPTPTPIPDTNGSTATPLPHGTVSPDTTAVPPVAAGSGGNDITLYLMGAVVVLLLVVAVLGGFVLGKGKK